MIIPIIPLVLLKVKVNLEAVMLDVSEVLFHQMAVENLKEERVTVLFGYVNTSEDRAVVGTRGLAKEEQRDRLWPLIYQGSREELSTIRQIDFLQKNKILALAVDNIKSNTDDDPAYLPPEQLWAFQFRNQVIAGVRQGAVAGPFLFNLAINDIIRRTVDQCPADIVLAPPGCPLTDLEYAVDVVIFAESTAKLQHVVNFVSKFVAAYGLRLRPDKCKEMWISLRPQMRIGVDVQLVELVDEFCYPRCMLKNNGSYEKDIQQRNL
ncbi:hypothetical protein RB195_022297 [Necator americanus]|uniref:Reverse transcriptase domain-containing protein n=1 Tax=Necator americanus TaxID=51031 RepID=A0ABR1EER2_NECAM